LERPRDAGRVTGRDWEACAAAGFTLGVVASSGHENGCIEGLEGASCGMVGAIVIAPFGTGIGALAGGLVPASAPAGARLVAGAGIGLFSGFMLGALACGSDCIVGGAVIGALSGLAAGSAVGERWQRAPARIGVTLLAPPRGLGLAVSVPLRARKR
jgi:hypothetical protein